jgi:hypothetical protein
MLSRAVRKRRPAVSGQHINAAAAIHTLFIRLIPRALRDIHHTRQYTRSKAAGQNKRPAVVVDLYLISIPDSAWFRIARINEDALGKGFLQPIVVIMGRVDAMQRVMPDGL